MLVNGSDLNKDYSITNKRSGVIVYAVKDGRLHFLLGVDKRTREYTDFGGGCKNNETLLQGAWREFQEESCGVFSMFSQNCLDTSIAVCNSASNSKLQPNSAIFFLEAPSVLLDIAPPMFTYIRKDILHEKANKKCLENIAIQWVDDDDFQHMAFNSSCKLMWSRIQRFLINNTEWNDLKMKIILKRAITIPERRGCYGIVSGYVDYPHNVSLSSLTDMYEKYKMKYNITSRTVIRSVG